MLRQFATGHMRLSPATARPLLKTSTVRRLVVDEIAGAGRIGRADELIADGDRHGLAEVNAEPAYAGIADPDAHALIAQGLDDDFLDVLMDAAGNEAPLLYLMHRRGYDPASLRKLESEIERELRQAREELARVQAEREVERRFVRDLRLVG